MNAREQVVRLECGFVEQLLDDLQSRLRSERHTNCDRTIQFHYRSRHELRERLQSKLDEQMIPFTAILVEQQNWLDGPVR